MTSEAGFSSSVSLSSDQVIDRKCTVCEEDAVVREAVSYCPACMKYFCSQCLQFHNKLLADHRTQLHDTADMLTSVAMASPRGALTSTCKEHGEKVEEMFCPEHDVVCCTVCVATKHRSCDNVAYIPDIAGGFSRSDEVSKIKSNLQDIKRDLAFLRSSRKHDQSRIAQEKARVLEQVKSTRTRVNEVFDNLEKAVAKGACERHDEFSDRIQSDLDECTGVIGIIDKVLEGIENTDRLNESELFVKVKKGNENLDRWRILCKHVENNLEEEKIVFVMDDSIEEYINSLEKLGNFVDQDLKQPTKVPKALKKMDATLKLEDDVLTCNLQGTCCLPDGCTLVTDYSNNALKRLNSAYQLTDVCEMNSPNAVCYASNTKEAAVSLGNYKTCIQVVSLGPVMNKRRTIELNGHDCYGIAYCKGFLYVGEYSGKNLHIYSYFSGQRLSTTSTDFTGQAFFADIRHISTNRSGTRLYIADHVNGLVIADADLNLQRVVKDDELPDVTGVCVDDDDNVIVCSEKAKAIVMFTPDGEKVCNLVKPGVLLGSPQSVSFDKQRSRLVVAMDDSNHVCVLDVE